MNRITILTAVFLIGLCFLDACSGSPETYSANPGVTIPPKSPEAHAAGGPLLTPSASQPTFTVLPPASKTPTIIQVTPTSTPTILAANTSQVITLTSTASPVPSATPEPGPLTLSIENVNRLTQLAWWGKGTPNTTAWAKDGSILAVGSALGIYLYDARTMKPLRFIYTGENVRLLAISPDGKRLATGSDRVLVWDTATGKNVGSLRGSVRGWLTYLAFSPGGTLLAALGIDGSPGDPPARLLVWNAESGQVLFTRETTSCGHGSSFVFTPDGQTILMNVCGFVDLLNSTTGELLKSLHIKEVESIAVTADGRNVIVATYNNQINILGISDETLVKSFSTNNSPEIALSPDGKTLAIYDVRDSARRVWGTQLLDIESGQFLFVLEHVGSCDVPSFSPDGTRLATIVDDEVQIWNTQTGLLVNKIAWYSMVNSITFGPFLDEAVKTKLVLAAGNQRGQVRLIDPANGSIIRTIEASELAVSSVALHPSGSLLAVGVSDKEQAHILLYDLTTEELLKIFDVLDQPYGVGIWGLAFSLDGEAIAAKISSFTLIEAWNIQSGEKLSNPGEKRWFNAQDIGGDEYGHLINLKYVPEKYEVHDLHTGEVLATALDISATGICQEYENYSISADNRYFAVGCDLWTLPVWDLAEQRLVSNSNSHKPSVGDGFMANITDISFSPYGYLIVSSGYDQTLRFWDARKGRLLLTISDHTCVVQHVTFSPDGRYVASAGCDGTLRLWGLEP